MSTLASGALLAAFSPARAEGALQALAGHGYVASRIGRALDGSGVDDLDGRPLASPERDEVARLLARESDSRG